MNAPVIPTHNAAFAMLVRIERDTPQHAAAVDSVMELLTAYRLLAQNLLETAQNAGRALSQHPDITTYQHNVDVFAAQLDRLSPPKPDFED